MQDQTTITTPGGKVVILKTWLTGRQMREISNIYLTNGMTVEDGKAKLSAVNTDAINKAGEAGWKAVVVSIDGKTDDIVNQILDLPYPDYKAIVDAVNGIIKDKDAEEKKTA